MDHRQITRIFFHSGYISVEFADGLFQVYRSSKIEASRMSNDHNGKPEIQEATLIFGKLAREGIDAESG